MMRSVACALALTLSPVIVNASAPVVNYATYLGNPTSATAATIDPVSGNLLLAIGPSLITLSPAGLPVGASTPIPKASVITALALDSQGRVVAAATMPDGTATVARPPDFATPVAGPVAKLVLDPSSGVIYAAITVSSPGHGADAAIVALSPDSGTVLSSYPYGGASKDTAADLAIDPAGSLYLALVTNSPELPAASGFQTTLNGSPGAISYDGGNFYYPLYGVVAPINQWLLADSNTLYLATQGQGVFLSTDRGGTFDTRNAGLPDLAVNAIAIDPANPSTLYAATASGLAKSTNAGNSWSTLKLSAADPVAAIAINPKNHNLYAATTACAFYRSTDAGLTWQAQQTKSAACITRFLTDPNDAAGVFAVSTAGVFQLPATGASDPTWNLVAPGAIDIVTDPATFNTWYANSAAGISKSTNKGASWTLILPGDFAALAAGKPYLAVADRQGNLQLSTDSGATWRASPSSPADGPQNIRSLHSDSGTLFAGFNYNSGIWVAKISPADGQILNSTFLGGTGSENAARLAVDSQGALTVAMETTSTDAITTLDGTQRQSGGGTDLVITRLTPNFTLQYATYYGGSGDEQIAGLQLDAQGFLYLAGATTSTDLPVTANALQSQNRGSREALLAVFNPSANGLLFASYFGGSTDDAALALLPDGRGNVVLAGRTSSSDLPTTLGAPYSGGPSDTFAVSISGLIGFQTLGTIRNAATLLPGNLAPGALATFDGSYGSPSGVAVSFNGVPATVVQSRAASMDVAIPAGLPTGQPVSVTIQSRAGLTQGSVQLDPVSPGLFSANRDGKGVALATLIRVFSDGSEQSEAVYQCSDTCTAIPIDFGDESDTLYLQLTATGLRNETDWSQFQVTAGGLPATVADIEPMGISPGLDVLTIVLPRPAAGFTGPAEWKIQVSVDGKTSNTVSIVVG